MKYFLFTVLSFGFLPAFAGSPEAFQAVLKVPEVTSMAIIEKVEVVQTFKCIQCYEFMVSGKRHGFTPNTLRDGYVIVRTEGTWETGSVIAEMVSQSK